MPDVTHSDWCDNAPDDEDDDLCTPCRLQREREAAYYRAQWEREYTDLSREEILDAYSNNPQKRERMEQWREDREQS